jgi:hypothetical protein
VDASGGVKTITLPDSLTNKGSIYVIQKSDISDNRVQVEADSSVGVQTVGGWIRYYLYHQKDTLIVISNGRGAPYGYDVILDSGTFGGSNHTVTVDSPLRQGLYTYTATAGDNGAFDCAEDRTGGTDSHYVFGLPYGPTQLIAVVRGRAVLIPDVDYTFTEGRVFLLSGSRAKAGETVRFLYYGSGNSFYREFDGSDGADFDCSEDRTGGTDAHYTYNLGVTPDSALVIRDHVILTEGVDYTLTGPTLVILSGARLLPGESLRVLIFKSSGSLAGSDNLRAEDPKTAGDGGAFDCEDDRTGGTASHYTFTLTDTPGNVLWVIVNDTVLPEDEYTLTVNQVVIHSGSRPKVGESVVFFYNVEQGVEDLITVGGDLSGTLANAKVVRLQQKPLSAPVSGDDGKCITYDSTSQSFGYTPRLNARQTDTLTTATLSDSASETDSFQLGNSYLLLKVETDVAARVRVYPTAAFASADLSRPIGTAPTGESGLLAEVVTDGANLLWNLAPAATGYADDPANGNSYVTVTNLSGGSATVTVTFTFLKLEAD